MSEKKLKLSIPRKKSGEVITGTYLDNVFTLIETALSTLLGYINTNAGEAINSDLTETVNDVQSAVNTLNDTFFGVLSGTIVPKDALNTWLDSSNAIKLSDAMTSLQTAINTYSLNTTTSDLDTYDTVQMVGNDAVSSDSPYVTLNTVNGLINPIKETMNALSDSINLILNTGAGSLQAQLTTAQADIQNIQDTITPWNTTIKEIRELSEDAVSQETFDLLNETVVKSNANVVAEIRNITTDVSENSASIIAHESKISDINTEIDDVLSKVASMQTQIQTDLSQVNSVLDQVSGAQTTANTALDKVNQLETDQSDFEAEINGKITDITNTANGAVTTANTVKTSMDTFVNTTWPAEKDSLDSQFATLQTKVDGQDTKIETAISKIGDPASDVLGDVWTAYDTANSTTTADADKNYPKLIDYVFGATKSEENIDQIKANVATNTTNIANKQDKISFDDKSIIRTNATSSSPYYCIALTAKSSNTYKTLTDFENLETKVDTNTSDIATLSTKVDTKQDALTTSVTFVYDDGTEDVFLVGK